jgi:glycosyltransferase involved in cell wall biosynthesis
MSKPSVLVTFDSMFNSNSGYHSFGRGLGDALIDQNHDLFKLHYYLFKSTEYQFDGKVDIVYLSKLYNIYFPRAKEFDLVHFTDPRCRLKPSKAKGKKIITIHDLNKVHIKQSKPHRIMAYVEKVRGYVAQCDRVVAISKFVARDILTYMPETKDKLSVIYNGADRLVVPDNHQPVYTPKKKFLFTIGLLSVQKGFHLLPCLLKDNDYELVISGPETPHKQRIIEEAEKYNVLDRVTITGTISDDDKAWYFKNCSAFVFPSIAEGFGLPVIEAMHFGKPVFLSKFTSLPEIGGDKAWYFDTFEPEDMQQAFNKGMREYEETNPAEDIAVHAAQFSWEKSAQQYLQLYQDCLNS